MNKKLIGALLVLITLGALGGYYYVKQPVGTIKKELKPLKVAYTEDGFTGKVIEFADEKGFFTDNGLRIEKIPSAKSTSTLLTSGQADVTFNMMTPALTVYLNDLDIVWVAKDREYPTEFDLVSRYSKDDANKIKNVAVDRLGGTQNLISELVTPVDDKSKLNYVLSPNEAGKLAMLENGSADMALINNLGDAGDIYSANSYTIFDQSETFSKTKMPGGIFTTKKMISDKNTELKDLIKAYETALDYVVKNQSEFKDYIVKKDELKESLVQVLLDKFIISLADDRKPVKSDVEGVLDVVAKVSNPKNPSRSLDDFIDASLF
ncbi:ABC transporter substrate-binding protein [bacterium]|nr:ABC transporter substrate-binding protein [bacterium]